MSATFAYEGVAWYARQTPDAGWSPLYRFRNKTNGTYLFSAYESEKNAIVANYSAIFELEGIAYYVRQDAPVNAPVSASILFVLPAISGQIGGNGYQALTTNSTGSISWLSSDPSVATVDSVGRVTFNSLGSAVITANQSSTPTFLSGTANYLVNICSPTSAGGSGYGLVFKACQGSSAEYYDKTECVKDEATGLIWQGQTTSGLRSSASRFSNYDSTVEFQYRTTALGSTINFYRRPTQSEINSSSNSIGFRNAVNISKLCGFSDWNLPSRSELQGLIKASEFPTIDNNWFPNTSPAGYWSYTSVMSANVSFAYWVPFFSGPTTALDIERDSYLRVRLVRSSP